MGNINQPNGSCNPTSLPEDKKAEKWNYRPPSASAIRRMEMFWLKHNRPGQSADADAVTPRSQTETVWNTLCRRRGAQVPQFDLQHPEGAGTGKGWIALLNPRIHELKHRYGYRIENRTERIGSDVKSWYWIVLGPDGTPDKTHPTTLTPIGHKVPTPRQSSLTPNGQNEATAQKVSSAVTERRPAEQDNLFGNPIRSAIGL